MYVLNTSGWQTLNKRNYSYKPSENITIFKVFKAVINWMCLRATGYEFTIISEEPTAAFFRVDN